MFFSGARGKEASWPEEGWVCRATSFTSDFDWRFCLRDLRVYIAVEPEAISKGQLGRHA